MVKNIFLHSHINYNNGFTYNCHILHSNSNLQTQQHHSLVIQLRFTCQTRFTFFGYNLVTFLIQEVTLLLLQVCIQSVVYNKERMLLLRCLQDIYLPMPMTSIILCPFLT